MRNLAKEYEWKKQVYKYVNISFRIDTEYELIEELKKKAKEHGLTLTEYCKKIISENA